MRHVSKNQISLAGEFAVLSQLALRGYDANLTLGHTKNVDILVSDSGSGRMIKLEVKTKFKSTKSQGGSPKLFGNYLSSWVMGAKHEKIKDPNLFYCFVNISKDAKIVRFFIVPSRIVADYVRKQHEIWLKANKSHVDTSMRTFRIGIEKEKYPILTPTQEKYENNWDFKK